jgi:hypothetical protein
MENLTLNQKDTNNTGLIMQPIQAGNLNGLTPEFGTSDDVRKYFGIKKGTLYNLHKMRKVRGKVLRVTGQFKGVRLWDMQSVRACILSQEDAQNIGLAA